MSNRGRGRAKLHQSGLLVDEVHTAGVRVRQQPVGVGRASLGQSTPAAGRQTAEVDPMVARTGRPNSGRLHWLRIKMPPMGAHGCSIG